MSNFKSVAITLEHEEGIFKSEKHVTLHFNHETVETIKQTVSTIIKEMKKIKKNKFMLTIESMDSNYHRESLYRYIKQWSWDTELDVRKFNGYDFSDKTEYKFVDESSIFKYLKKELEKICLDVMDGVPDDGKCWYARKISSEDYYIPENVLVALND